jgi:hypothetical protein
MSETDKDNEDIKKTMMITKGEKRMKSLGKKKKRVREVKDLNNDKKEIVLKNRIIK